MPINQPAMAFQFIVHVEGTPPDFKLQTVAFAMNFAKKELLLVVEQSINAPTREHIVIQEMIDNPKRLITLEIMDPAMTVVDTIKFTDCVVLNHQVDFSYASVATVLHDVVLSYDKADLGNGTASSAYSSAMSVIGRP